jgi:hypothetical protein
VDSGAEYGLVTVKYVRGERLEGGEFGESKMMRNGFREMLLVELFERLRGSHGIHRGCIC